MNSVISFPVTAMFDLLKTALLSAVFPKKCLVCGTFFHAESYHTESANKKGDKEITLSWPSLEEAIQGLMTPHICQDCISDFLPIQSPICKRCGMMFEAKGVEEHHCGHCIQFPKSYGIARAVALYKGACMELVHAYKYRGKVQLAQPLGMLLFYTFLRYFPEAGIHRIIPVPLHQKRLKQRGFNQVYLLIRKWPEYLNQVNGFQFGKPEIEIGRDDLIRNRLTDPQTGLGRRQRVSNVSGVFSVRNPAAIAEKAILLVDDVYTTGATVDACTKVLLKNGAGRIDVLTLARAM